MKKTLASMLGDKGANAALYHLSRLSGFDLRNPDPASFEEGMVRLYGVAGRVIIKQVVEEMYREVGMEPPEDSAGSLGRHLENIRRAILEK